MLALAGAPTRPGAMGRDSQPVGALADQLGMIVILVAVSVPLLRVPVAVTS